MQRETILGRIGTVGAMSLGFQVIYCTALVVIVSLLASQTSEIPPNDQPQLVGIVDGQPISFPNNLRVTDGNVARLDGERVKLGDGQKIGMGADLYTNAQVRGLSLSLNNWTAQGFAVRQNYTEPWYFVHDRVGRDYTGYFVGYSNFTRAPIGYIGANGPATELPAPAQRFQLLRGASDVLTEEGYQVSAQQSFPQGVGTNGKFLLLTKSGVTVVDVPTRTVTNVLMSQDVCCLARSQEYEYTTFGGMQGRGYQAITHTIARDSNSLYVIKSERITAKYTIPESLRTKALTASPVDAQTIYYATNDGKQGYYWRGPQDVLKCDASGQILQQWKVKQPPVEKLPGTSPSYLASAALFPIPVPFAGVVLLTDPVYEDDGSAPPSRIWPGLMEEEVPSLLLVLVFGVISTIVAWRWTPRFSGRPAETGWLVFIFAFGLPGLMGYLMHFRHKTRPTESAPALLGTEIFG